MPTRRTWLMTVTLVISLLISTRLVSELTVVRAQDDDETPQLAILFPGDVGFDDFEDLTESTTQLSGAEWVTEFDKQTKFGDASSGNGLVGIIYLDALRMAQLFSGASKFLFYGLFSFPAQYPVNPTDDEVPLGVVAYLTPDALVIVLIDLEKSGEITAFVVVPREGSVSPVFPLINLESYLAVFFILESLPNVGTGPLSPLFPLPGSASQLACPEGLTKVRDLNVTLSSAQSITVVKDSSGADLFEIGVAPPNKMTIKSFSDKIRVDAVYTAVGTTHLIFLAGPGSQEVELTPDQKFVLSVTADEKQACVIATPSESGDNLRISGELQAN